MRRPGDGSSPRCSRSKTGPRPAAAFPRQYLDDWLAGSPLVEIVFDDEGLRAAASAAG
jgi:hypothetical protein